MKDRLLLYGIVATLAISFVSLAQQTKEVRKTLPLKEDGRVVVDTYKGSITVNVWDKSEVEVLAKVEADDDMFDAGEENVNDTQIRIDGNETEVRIVTDYEKVHRHRRGFWGWFSDNSEGPLPFVHYTISMPRTANLKIKDYKSRTSITDLHASVELNTYKGDVRIVGLQGSMDLETYKGDARVEFAKLAERSRFESYKGEITIKLPRRCAFDVDSEFGRRVDFSSDFDIPSRSRGRWSRSTDYRGSVNGGGPRIELKSEKGTFAIREGS